MKKPFVVILQPPSGVQHFVTPWTPESQAFMSFTSSQSLPKFMSTESVMTSNLLILSHPFLPFYRELKITDYMSNWGKWCTTRYKKTQNPTATFEDPGANTACQEQKQGMAPAHSSTGGEGKVPKPPPAQQHSKDPIVWLRGPERHTVNLFKTFFLWLNSTLSHHLLFFWVFFFFKISHHLPLCSLSFLHSTHDDWATGKWGEFF